MSCAIAADVARGLTPAEASAKYGVTLSTVQGACREHRVSWRRLEVARGVAGRKLIAADVAAGLTAVEARVKHGVSMAAVYRACQEHGVACASGFGRRVARRKLVAADVAAGLTVAEASAKHGVSLELVYKACQEHGVPLPGQRNKLSLNTYAIVAALLYTKKTLGQIAQEFRVSRQRVHQISKAARAGGIKIKQR